MSESWHTVKIKWRHDGSEEEVPKADVRVVGMKADPEVEPEADEAARAVHPVVASHLRCVLPQTESPLARMASTNPWDLADRTHPPP